VEELTASGSLTKAYTYGLHLISQRQSSGTVHFFGTDGLGSTRFLTDSGGAVANTFAYDAYGTLIASNATAQTSYLFTGEQLDVDLGLYYLGVRYRSPGLGRFWTMDRFEGWPEEPLTLHNYLYCRDNPLNMVDPSGYDGNVISLNVSSGLVAGLAAFTAASIYEAKTHAIGTLFVASYEGFRNAIRDAEREYVFYNKKQTEAVVAGLIATATAHVSKLEGFGGGGSDPNDPRNHWRKEIKAALARAKRLIEKRLTGDKQEELLKKVKELADKSEVTLD